jgi:2-keto-3-deoxy-L-rhamnonate aldolase RhmA
MANRTKLAEKIARKQRMLGLELYSGSPHIVEIAGQTGFDFTMLDTEHTEFDTEHMATLIRAADSFGLSPVVRIQELDQYLIMKALDRGADGVIVPRVNTAEQAQRAVAAAEFPPKGVRGMCPDVRATRYRTEDWLEYARNIEDHVAVIPLIEDDKAVQNIEEIVQVEGIKAVLFGPGDYAVSIGAVQAGFSEKIMRSTREALRKVCDAASRHGVYVFAIPLELQDPDTTMNALFEDGVSGVLFGTDTMHLQIATDRIKNAFDGVVRQRNQQDHAAE